MRKIRQWCDRHPVTTWYICVGVILAGAIVLLIAGLGR